MVETNEILKLIEKICDDKIADNIIHMEVNTGVCDYFVIASARNINHSRAIIDAVEEELENHGIEIVGKEGYREGNWILLDVGDIILHVFTEDTRKYYDLEKLWT